jgi:hypothetical protein
MQTELTELIKLSLLQENLQKAKRFLVAFMRNPLPMLTPALLVLGA